MWTSDHRDIAHRIIGRSRCFAAVALFLGVLLFAPSCVVVAIDHFYDEASLTFDDLLLGVWRDADDNVSVTVERGEWRSYRLTYDHPTEKGVLTGYLFRNQGRLYLDLMPVRGVDLGSFALSAHALVRITAGASVTASPLRFQWFDAALSQQMLPSTLGGARSERGSLVLGADHVALQKWLAARPTADPAFGPEATFTRIAGGTRN